MPIDSDKIKATDYLTESLKLIVVIATILISGLLTFQDSVNSSNKYYFYTAIIFWLITLLWSVININQLINKIYRGEEDAIKQKDTKNTFSYVTITLIIGIISGLIFIYSLSNKSSNSKIKNNQISITNEEIIMDNNFSKKIKISKFQDGTIKEVIIN